ncbi:hypothetical protein [Nonomuraea turcica]|uniref:hypothetical protein n=1 Tax=Nonomuraea sp. G32 TaxID=3067274 RepID=UPI00273B6E82|nr:hypothetical protein [Nonomuraea sp. G32]MDP4511739.1 hypothetical protein [Nonomuraea sp. G32]
MTTQGRKLAAGELTLVDDDTPTVFLLRQMRECDFLTMLAIRLAQEVPARSMARSRLLPFEPFEAYLYNIRDAVIGRGNVQAWINREYVDMPAASADRPFNGTEAIERMAARFRLASRLSEAAHRNVPAEAAAQTRPAAASPLGPPAPAAITGGLGCPPPPAALATAWLIRNTPTSGLPSSTWYGQIVHEQLQTHYRWAHPQNCVLSESRLSGPCTSATGGTLRPNARQYGNLDVKAWAMAMGSSRTGQFRPDIADLTTNEVWEIKSRGEVVEGVNELYGLYLCRVNQTIAAINAVATVVPGGGMRPYRPGTSWIPFGLYPVTPTVTAWVHAELPGIIYYDLFAVPPFVVPYYSEQYSEQEARARQRSTAQRSTQEDDFSPWWIPVGAALALLALAASAPAAAVAAAGVALIVAADEDVGKI